MAENKKLMTCFELSQYLSEQPISQSIETHEYTDEERIKVQKEMDSFISECFGSDILALNSL